MWVGDLGRGVLGRGGDVEVDRGGGVEVRRSDDVEVWRCGGLMVWRCGGWTVWRCGGMEMRIGRNRASVRVRRLDSAPLGGPCCGAVKMRRLIRLLQTGWDRMCAVGKRGERHSVPLLVFNFVNFPLSVILHVAYDCHAWLA